MKFAAQITVVGMKGSKGDMEGVPYDHTTVYSTTAMDDSKGNAKGDAGCEYRFGTSAEFDKFKHLPFPFLADCQFQVVTSGKAQKTILLSCVPVQRKAA